MLVPPTTLSLEDPMDEMDEILARFYINEAREYMDCVVIYEDQVLMCQELVEAAIYLRIPLIRVRWATPGPDDSFSWADPEHDGTSDYSPI